ncbi:MAG: acyltransferase family protein [Bacteroidales bacterium]|nr:acyltransferase family protein [Bacteroidales bacterium]
MERNQAIDIAKGIGILLVLLGHLPLPYWFINTIYFFHMPLFVALSGYFSKEQNIGHTLKKSAAKIALPYIFYGFVFCCINYLQFKNIGTLEFIGFLVARPMDIWQINFFGVFWFMIALFIIKILAAIIPNKKYILVLSLIFFFTIPLLVNRFEFIKNLPFALAQGGILLIFYSLGAFLSKIKPKQNTIILAISTLSFTLFAIFFIFKFDGMHNKITNYHNLKLFNTIGAFVIAIMGIISTFTFSNILSTK